MSSTSQVRHRGRRAGWYGLVPLVGLVLIVGGSAGCRASNSTPRVLYLDGAGWFGSSRSIRAGLRAGGYSGSVEAFTWTSFLGAGADHFVAARSRIPARRLARRIEAIRRQNPQGKLHLVGRSSGTAVVVRALEELPDDVLVDQVLLLSSSLSSRHNLAEALEHVGGRLYATVSRGDMLLAGLPLNADGQFGPPAGRRGFVLPSGLPDHQRRLYAKVINLPWRPAYAGFGWKGGHFNATRAKFIEKVIAPRLLSEQPFPLDRPLVLIAPGQPGS